MTNELPGIGHIKIKNHFEFKSQLETLMITLPAFNPVSVY